MGSVIQMHATLGEMRPTLLKLARLQLRNDAMAEDVVSETMIAALERAGSFEGRSKLRTWVIGILKHKIVDQLRRGMREVPLENADDGGEDEQFDDLYTDEGRLAESPRDWGDPEQALRQRQFLDVIHLCVEAMPGNLGRVFLMREWLEQDTAEICTQMGITATNCHVMLFRARMRLRECVEAHWLQSKGGPGRGGAAA